MTDLRANLSSVLQRVEAAARRSGRDPAEITLVAVTKTQPAEVVWRAYELGLRDFGENRVEEIEAKAPQLPPDIRWHMIGHIQSRKARPVGALCSFVHSVDSLKLATKLSQCCTGRSDPLPVLVEVNVTGETTKYGLRVAGWVEEELPVAEILTAIEPILSLPHIRVQGLMAMAPIVAEPELARPHFTHLRRLGIDLARLLPQAGRCHLSMGMSDDFEVAIEEGATMIRLGRALFAPGIASCQMSHLALSGGKDAHE
jgi:hypothetical protein